MSTKLDITELKEALINIFESYIAKPDDIAVKRKAKDVYLKYMGADPLLPKLISEAKNILVNVAYETGVRPDMKRIKALLVRLKAQSAKNL